MATKKKKKENKKKSNSRPSFGNKHGKLYVVEDLEKIMNAVFLPQTTAFDKQLAMAAAYASDVVEYAKDNGAILDFTVETEGALAELILPKWVLFKRGQGRGDEWARDQLEKSVAAYQLFLLCNYINQTRETTGLLGTIERNKMARAGIVVQANNEKKHKKATFDPFEVMHRLSEECFSFSDEPTDFVCSLAPFRQEVTDVFIDKMVDIADAATEDAEE